MDVATQVLQRYGKTLTQAAHRAALGKRPLDCWRDVAAELGLQGQVTPEQLVAESEPLLAARWARRLAGLSVSGGFTHVPGIWGVKTSLVTLRPTRAPKLTGLAQPNRLHSHCNTRHSILALQHNEERCRM